MMQYLSLKPAQQTLTSHSGFARYSIPVLLSPRHPLHEREHNGIRNMVHAELRKSPNDKARRIEIARDLADASFFVRAPVST